MGWKNVKDHYQIEHLVSVTEKGICIGSGFIQEIMVIDWGGTITKRAGFLGSEEFRRYESEMEADPEKLRELIHAKDTFETSISVYTFKGAEIIEMQAEKAGYPNVTHDGELMSENEFSVDKQKVIRWAKQYANSNIEGWKNYVEHCEKELQNAKDRLANAHDNQASLESQFPTVDPKDA
jgi:cellobiose-specific phosphotransferase system component IIA